MKNSIVAEEIFLGALLKNYVLSVPYYQRPYSWETTQVSDLIVDLSEASEEAKVRTEVTDLDEEIASKVGQLPPYFFGSIVLSETEDSSGEWYYDIVDGQQRLATLTMLLSVLRYVESDREPWITPLIYPKADPTSVTQRREYRLIMGNHDNDFFQKYIQTYSNESNEIGIGAIANGQINIEEHKDSEQRILAAAQYLFEKVNNMDSIRRKTLITFVISRCQFVMVKNENFETAYRVFSIMNNRGLELNHGDILKAQTLGAQHRDLTETWENMEQQLGRNHFQELFSHIRMIYRKQKQRESILEEIRKHVKPDRDPEHFVKNVLVKYGDAQATILACSYKHTQREKAKRVNELFRMLNDHDNSDWLPPAIYFLSQKPNDPASLIEFFEALERLATWIFVTRQNSTRRLSRHGSLLRILTDIFETDEPSQDTITSIDELYTHSESPLRLSQEEQSELVKVLNGNIYNHKASRYILLRLSALITDKTDAAEYKGDSKVTIEHVLPQNPPPNSQWLEWFPDETVRRAWTHRIANLVLLSGRKNSSAKNYELDKKIDGYFKEKMATYALTISVLAEAQKHGNKWTPDYLKERQERLVDILTDTWKLTQDVQE